MAVAMWMRVVGVCVLPFLTVMVVVGDGHEAEKVLGYGMLFGTGLGVVSLAWFGVGALEVVRSRHVAAPRLVFLIAGVASLWCAGVTLNQMPDLYGVIAGRASEWGREYSFATMFPYVLPLVATSSMIVGALAIGSFAKRREQLEIGARGDRAAILVGVMQLLAMGVTSYLLPEARSNSSALLLMLMALGFGLVAVVSMARLARDAALAVEAAPPELPSAQLL
jgi:apolipoprotein N-acyltransferase